MKTSLGATLLDDHRCRFEVWAPKAERVEVRVVFPDERCFSLEKRASGYHVGVADNLGAGARYFYRLNGKLERPDPASRFQPLGVHGSTEIVDSEFDWTEQNWGGLPLEKYILYEVHAGTFTADGTFDAAASRLNELKDLGVTAIELMPVGQFPGSRNWGYDGVYPFAAQASYGGPQALKRFVNACHARGMAVVLDVIYNHLGPEGNYLADFAPYFTDRYNTPWGWAINYDGADSDEVRRYFIENALSWVTDFHLDALRLDAVHAIVDPSARPFLEELGEAVHKCASDLNRNIYLIPESDRNDSRFVTSRQAGGMGLDAQWSDDFHHALHTLMTGEKAGYYEDFGRLGDLAKAYREGYVYSGQYSSYRRRRHGNSSQHLAAHQFVVFSQNHDQVGNRMLGERLTKLIPFEALKVVAGTVLLSPFVPLLFMGEEYGDPAPFLYFTSHSDDQLIEAVRKGRREEFAAFRWQGEVPDPHDEATFLRSKLDWGLQSKDSHREIWGFYKELIRLRKTIPALAKLSMREMAVTEWSEQRVLSVRRWAGTEEAMQLTNFSSTAAEVAVPVPVGSWSLTLDSHEARWGGPGGAAPVTFESEGEMKSSLPPYTFWLFTKSDERQ